MAIAAGAAGVGVGWAVNRLQDELAMQAVRSAGRPRRCCHLRV